MRNSELTREKILEAALAEFSAFGIAGARVDRIAEAAGCNKNLIYVYFENKEALFRTILRKHLAQAYEHIVFTPNDLAGYAEQVFEGSMSQPHLMRLMAWHALEQAGERLEEREASRAAKIEELEASQREGRITDEFPASFLLTALMALSTAWGSAGVFAVLDEAGSIDRAALRSNVAKAIRKLTA